MAKKASKAKKFPVYVIDCPENDISGLHVDSMEGAGDFISGDLDNNPEATEFNYKITVKMMTARQYNRLPEYEF